jgi:hypothetical protein
MIKKKASDSYGIRSLAVLLIKTIKFRSNTDSRFNVVHTKTYRYHYKGHEIPKVKSFGTLNRNRRPRIHRSELLNMQQADTCPFLASQFLKFMRPAASENEWKRNNRQKHNFIQKVNQLHVSTL